MMKFIGPGSIALRLQFEESNDISLLELSSLFYDFTLMYDCIALTTIPKYQKYKFSQFFWYRKGRPLNPEHALYVKQISHKSPIILVTAITAAAAALGMPWLLIQAIEKISNWKLNRKKLELEVENLKLNNEILYLEKVKSRVGLESELYKRKAMEVFSQIIQRLKEHKMSVINAKFYVIDESGKEKPSQ